MKFGVCAILKNENLYLREWVEHYISLGFDKIILYDNNDINGETPNIVIQDYINDGIVDLYNMRGLNVDVDANFECSIQTASYNKCLEKYKDELDWIAFLDIDEFLELEIYKKIQSVFNHYDYNDFDGVLISTYMIGDDNKLYYENKPVQERFKEHRIFVDTILGINNMDQIFKCIVNTKSNKKFNSASPHNVISDNLCNVYRYKINLSYPCRYLNAANHDIMYFKHYYTKSFTEFLYKIHRYSWSTLSQESKFKIYKTGCNWTDEHEKLYQRFLSIDKI